MTRTIVLPLTLAAVRMGCIQLWVQGWKVAICPSATGKHTDVAMIMKHLRTDPTKKGVVLILSLAAVLTMF